VSREIRSYRLGSSINANLHYHLIVIEGGLLDRTDQGLKPRFVKVEPPSDAVEEFRTYAA
jgi:hypothetical protein